MTILWIVIVPLIFFGLVIFRGAPYLPTLKPQVKEAISLLELKKGQTLLELGSGDGRMLRAAAEQGIYSIGYELNPFLVLWTKLRHWRYRRFITVKWRDCWLVEWPPSDGMYVFLLPKYMQKLDNKVVQYTKGKPYKVVSFTFKINGRKPLKSSKGLRLYQF